jgi:hypothetical protein
MCIGVLDTDVSGALLGVIVPPPVQPQVQTQWQSVVKSGPPPPPDELDEVRWSMTTIDYK